MFTPLTSRLFAVQKFSKKCSKNFNHVKIMINYSAISNFEIFLRDQITKIRSTHI